MKNKLMLLVAAFFLLIYTACQRYKYPEMYGYTASLSEEAAEGEKYYMQYCQKCHPNGEGGLGPPVYFLPSFSKKFQTRHGLGVMPSLEEEVLSDEKLDKITAYLKELRESD